MRALIALLMFILPVGTKTSSSMYYWVQRGTPLFLPNFIEPGAGCEWAGVAGQVFDQTGQPAEGLFVRIYGVLEGQLVDYYLLSGGAVQIGPGGYELKLADHLVTGQFDLNMQLLDIFGEPVSTMVHLPLQAHCEKNLTLVNFVFLIMEYESFLPVVIRK